MSFPPIEQQTIGEPLANPWYTPGFTSQKPDYQVLPPNKFNIAGYPSTVIYVTVTANYFDDDGNPIAGYLTFYPSSSLTFTSNSVVTTVPQRFVGQSLWDMPGAFWGSGKVYLRNGNLLVSLLATDNAGISMSPVSFSYAVVEHWLGGRSYDIVVPSNSTSPVDINSLIVPGSTEESTDNTITLASSSTEFIPANVTGFVGGTSFNPTSDVVQFAFISGPTQPGSGDWNTGSWSSSNAPYIAEILVGPANGGLVLAPGSYIIWVKVITTSQVPVFQVGTLVIY